MEKIFDVWRPDARPPGVVGEEPLDDVREAIDAWVGEARYDVCGL